MQIIEIKTNLQVIINPGLSLKPPDSFVSDDRENKVRFETKEDSIKVSQLTEEMKKSSKTV